MVFKLALNTIVSKFTVLIGDSSCKTITGLLRSVHQSQVPTTNVTNATIGVHSHMIIESAKSIDHFHRCHSENLY